MEPPLRTLWNAAPEEELEPALRLAVEAVRQQPLPEDGLARSLDFALQFPVDQPAPRPWFGPKLIRGLVAAAAVLLIGLALVALLCNIPIGGSDEQGSLNWSNLSLSQGKTAGDRQKELASYENDGFVDVIRSGAEQEETRLSLSKIRQALLVHKVLPKGGTVPLRDLLQHFCVAAERQDSGSPLRVEALECPWNRGHALVWVHVTPSSSLPPDLEVALNFDRHQVSSHRLLGRDRSFQIADPSGLASEYVGKIQPDNGLCLLYEIQAASTKLPPGDQSPPVVVKLRSRNQADPSTPASEQVVINQVKAHNVAAPQARLAAAVAGFALLLEQGEPMGPLSFAKLQRLLPNPVEGSESERSLEFRQLLQAASALKGKPGL
jgi:hypothetical protein